MSRPPYDGVDLDGLAVVTPRPALRRIVLAVTWFLAGALTTVTIGGSTIC